jgi:hypothetical protein
VDYPHLGALSCQRLAAPQHHVLYRVVRSGGRGLVLTDVRRPFERDAVSVQRRPVRHGIAGPTVPAGVSASAVSEAGDVSDEDLIRAEGCPFGQ